MNARRTRCIWTFFALSAAIFALSAAIFLAEGFLYGPFALIVGALAVALGGERVMVLWRTRHRIAASALLVMVGAVVAAMLLPIWGHEAFWFEDGKKYIEHHSHYLWENDHLH